MNAPNSTRLEALINSLADKGKLTTPKTSKPIDAADLGDADSSHYSRIDDVIGSAQPPGQVVSDRKLLERLKKMKLEASKAKKGNSTNWDAYPKFYRGTGQWADNRPSHRVSGLINLCQQLIEKKTALLTDTKPIIRVVPNLTDSSPIEKRKAAVDTAKLLEKYIECIWQEHGLLDRMAQAITYAQIFGSAGTNTCIDFERGRQGPDPTFFVLDPRQVFVDPYISTFNDMYRANYVYTDSIDATDRLRWLYPKFRDKLKPSSLYTGTADEEGPAFLRSKIRKLFGFESGEYVEAIDRTELTEFWIQDYDLNLAGKRNFPNGRHIIMANDNLILVDEPNPYIDGQFPIDMFEWHFDINSAWGFGDVELYKPAQDIYNKVLSLLVENASLMTNSIWIGDANALTPEEWKKLVNAPGKQVKIRPGSNLKREAPPPLPNGLFEMLNYVMGGMEKLSGMSSVMEGQAPGGVEAGVAIDSLMAASQTMIRFKARTMENLMHHMGQKLISRIFQFMPDHRFFTLIGDSQQVLNYHFDRKKYITTPDLAFKDFNFTIIPGSSLQVNKWKSGMMATQLFQLGIIKSPKRVLDALEYPDREAIVLENAQVIQAEMQQQLIMAQAGQAGQPGAASGAPKPPNSRGSTGAGGRRDDQPIRSVMRSPEDPGAKVLAGSPETSPVKSQIP